jgi:hypothetical protein
MFGVRRYPKLPLLHGDDSIHAHKPRNSIQGTRDLLFIAQLFPYPRAAVVTVIIPEYPAYFNEQIIVIDSVLAFRPFLKRVISAPGYFHRAAHFIERKT